MRTNNSIAARVCRAPLRQPNMPVLLEGLLVLQLHRENPYIPATINAAWVLCVTRNDTLLNCRVRWLR